MSAPPLPAVPAAANSAAQGLILRDIHLPADPSWWPLAPGWWGLLGVLAVTALIFAWWRRLRRRRLTWVARVLEELDQLAARYAQDRDPQALAGRLHQLMRRAALRLDPQAFQARGADWQSIIERIRLDAPRRQLLLTLDLAMYRPMPSFDAEGSIEAARAWLQRALLRRPGRHNRGTA